MGEFDLTADWVIYTTGTMYMGNIKIYTASDKDNFPKQSRYH